MTGVYPGVLAAVETSLGGRQPKLKMRGMPADAANGASPRRSRGIRTVLLCCFEFLLFSLTRLKHATLHLAVMPRRQGLGTASSGLDLGFFRQTGKCLEAKRGQESFPNIIERLWRQLSAYVCLHPPGILGNIATDCVHPKQGLVARIIGAVSRIGHFGSVKPEGCSVGT